jgi:hypothetical protein
VGIPITVEMAKKNVVDRKAGANPSMMTSSLKGFNVNFMQRTDDGKWLTGSTSIERWQTSLQNAIWP